MRLSWTILLLLICVSSVVGFSTCNNGSIPVGPGDNGNGGGGGNGNVPNDPPTALMGISPLLRAYSQQSLVDFDGTFSTDPDANIATYDWDFHYDGQTFHIDSTGPRLTYNLPSFGSVVAALRVTDSGTPALSSTIRKRLNVMPTGEIANVTDGAITKFILRKSVASGNDFYVLYTGTFQSTVGAYVQRSADGGATWGDPVIVSSAPADSGPWGIWMDAAPFGIVLGWISNAGDIKYANGKPSGTDSIIFSTPSALANAGTEWYEPVLYSIACTPTGDWVYLVYMTTNAYELKLITAPLDSSGAAGTANEITVIADNADRFRLSGASVAAGPTGRGFIAYIWKSLGYDNDDQVYLNYFTPPVTALDAAIRADSGLVGFNFDHDIYLIVNNDDEPIVYFRTTGIFQGGRDIALCISDGNPPVFRPTIRGNNTLDGDILAAQSSPSVAFDRDHGQLWLAFEDYRVNTKISDVYLTMFDNQYSTILPDFNVSDDPAHIMSDINPQISFRAGQNPALVVLWEQNATDIVAYHASY